MPFRTRLVVPAIAVALLLTPTLAGCGIVDSAVDQATGGQVSVGGELPRGWPEEVPVVDGKILVGAGGQGENGSGWIVTVDATAADPIAEATTQLEGAGFSVDGSAAEATTDDGGFVAMKNENYSVLVAGTKDGLLYTVTPVTGG
ncbi:MULTISPECIES: hypothetical protein [unclassified Leifsonia]|uniref:hypothetical protein n=1 Tax=unclassified Leifsonia TaxID=2663824 RepID=UPI000701FF99|nr:MULTISPECIES: hypothetical protein [unclassified Leifsonia]KQX07408.1 hypothetical protein ASC59_06485 [Leifsonia sp. Root1293]KRA11690.1 hypothetical protein ASD61_06485 [Leifsonia sp. Root60]